MPDLDPQTLFQETSPAPNQASGNALKARSCRKAVPRRHLALHVPQLPLDRWRRREDIRLTGPFAVTDTLKSAERLVCINDPARAAGVKPGQSLTDARAICPDLLTEPRDILQQDRLLSSLHRWADRYSPRISLIAPDGLVLDITGCAHLFGGEEPLARAMLESLADLKVTARIGIANTQAAARGFARFGRQLISRSDPFKEAQQVGQLPLGALGLDAKIEEELARLGVKTIADLSQFKSSELARRFSVRLPLALDAIRGHRPDPVVPSAAPLAFAAQMTLPEPIAHKEAIQDILRRLSERVCSRLQDKQYAARGFHLTVRCVEAGNQSLRIGFSSPDRSPKAILRQFERPLDTLSLPFGADWFRLQALDTQIFKPQQIILGDKSARDQQALDQTLTTLGNRLGFDRINHPISAPFHSPEREHGAKPVVDARKSTPKPISGIEHLHPRPALCFRPERLHVIRPGRPPKDFQWRKDRFFIVKAEGPERIAPVWWDNPPSWLEAQLRDYWRVSTQGGRQLWLLTCPQAPDQGWFCAGEFI